MNAYVVVTEYCSVSLA